ncbi:ribbon-helix-helix CopG family protein [Herbihabitans rhizosphaerae]|uniref:Ribbon-helix-helix CopG family protein n=1 Tax=Herbihabitans rhizosphaerae TaxID=1872711 RepID=A0A4Q7KLD5_9PSEU|nr:ribbon-helix-helix protein, CopG family [Herbihabitans rhizosphaerae]RZS34756.1 ribbon-helix-helix CopG family protein [Herbihabitans rhizosphaerae]
MKTAISVPDDTFSRAEERAAQLGISRSEFFARAAEDYLTRLDEHQLTEQIDEAVALIADHPEGADSNEDAVRAGHAVLAANDEW